jgi:hypothetical protein
MLVIALAIGLGDWSVVAADLVGSGGCGLLDAGKPVYSMTGHGNTPAASFVAVVGGCTGTGNHGPVQHGRYHLSSMP